MTRIEAPEPVNDWTRWRTRFILFTGKGGVGKTTAAAALAVALCDEGMRVLIVSTDPASNLSGVFKDRDFVDGHLLAAEPRRLLLVVTGNIGNDVLMDLFAGYSDALAMSFDDVEFVELDRDVLVLHG